MATVAIVSREEERPGEPSPPSTISAPLLPVAHEYATVTAVRSAVLSHDQGFLRTGALLAERMRWNPRIWSALQTRTNGLIATEVRWREGRANRDGRKALAAWREDYPRMVPTAVRRQRAWDALMLGMKPGQRDPLWNPATGRWLLRYRPYWTGFVNWSEAEGTYQIDIRDGQAARVPSPAITGEAINPLRSPWCVYEPNGPYSWRWGLLHPFWYAWFGLDRCIRDGFRFAEKHGLGIMLAFLPDGSGDEFIAARDRFISKLRTMGSEGVIPCQQGRNKEDPAFDVKPLEFTGGAGYSGIEGARNGANVDIAVSGLGHNLTTEIKGGSFAAAGVGDYIRSDFKRHDVSGEIAHDEEQIGRPWALYNFGDPDLAPIGDGETDPPAADQTAAATLQALGQFLSALPEEIRALVDIDALFDRFRVALRNMTQVPRRLPQPEDGDEQPDEGQPQPDGATAQPSDKPAQPEGDDVMAKGKIKQQQVIALTPTDLATIVKVDEGRASIGLPPESGETGGKWISQHSAEIRAAAAPETAEAAAAESGALTPGAAPIEKPTSPDESQPDKETAE